MVEHFFDNEKVVGRQFRKGRTPKNYKRILFFVGVDARENPFLYMRGDCQRKVVAALDLEAVAKHNIGDAAHHLWKYDRANVTPEMIDAAVELLFGEKKWCKVHYEEILAKLSKRSKKFLEDVKPWKPSWAK